MFKCENCEKEFKGKSGKSNRFCSKACYNKWRKGKPAPNMDGLKLGRGWNKGQSAEWAKGENNVNWAGGKVTLICQECEKEYEVWPYLKDESKYCSTECSDKHTLALGRGWNKGISTPSNGVLEKYIEENGAWNKGKLLSAEHKKKLSQGHKLNPTRYWLGKNRPDISEKKIGKPNFAIRGENNVNWNGGSSRDYRSHYNNLEYRNWRREVFKRDNFTCQECGKRGGYLEAHHKVGWAEDKSKRYGVDNGMTLCRQCHIDTDRHRAKFVKDKQS